MARTQNEITRDEQQTNLLLAIISELKEINKNINKLNTGGKNAK